MSPERINDNSSISTKAVCYLNNYGEDFSGGMFHFQDGEPENYVPMAGVSIFSWLL